MASQSFSTPEVVPCEGLHPASVYEDWRNGKLQGGLTQRENRLFSADREGAVRSGQRVRRCTRCQRAMHQFFSLEDDSLSLPPCATASEEEAAARTRTRTRTRTTKRAAAHSSVSAEDEDFVCSDEEHARSRKRKIKMRIKKEDQDDRFINNNTKSNINGDNSNNFDKSAARTHLLVLATRGKRIHLDLDHAETEEHTKERKEELIKDDEDDDGPLLFTTPRKRNTPKENKRSTNKNKDNNNKNTNKQNKNKNNNKNKRKKRPKRVDDYGEYSFAAKDNNNNSDSDIDSDIGNDGFDEAYNEAIADSRFHAIAERIDKAVRAGDETSQYLCTQALLCDPLFSHARARSSISVTLAGDSLKPARWSLCWGFSHRDREGRLSLPALDAAEREHRRMAKRKEGNKEGLSLEEREKKDKEEEEQEQQQSRLSSFSTDEEHAQTTTQLQAGDDRANEEEVHEKERLRRHVPVLTRDDLLRVFGSADFEMESASSSSSAQRSLRPFQSLPHRNGDGDEENRVEDNEKALQPEEDLNSELHSLLEEENNNNDNNDNDDESLKSIHSERSSLSPLLFLNPAQMQTTAALTLNSAERRFLSPFPFQLNQEPSPSSANIALQRVRQFLSVKRHPACRRYAVSVDCRKWWDRNICYHCRTTLNKRKVKSLEDRAALAGKVNYSLLCFDELVIQHDMLKEEIARLKMRLAEFTNKNAKK